MGPVEIITRSRDEGTGKGGESSREQPNELPGVGAEMELGTTAPKLNAARAQQRPAFVELRGVTRRYGRLVALKGIDLSIQPGEFVIVTGPSEAGKTTLLKLIRGDLRPNSGS